MLPNLQIRHVLFLLPIFGLVFILYLSLASAPTRQGGDVIKQMTAFVGGKFEASGVAGVPGTDGVLFVDNGRIGQVFWMSLDHNGKQVGPIKTVALGVNIEDIEGITTDGTYFYVVSSQSRPKAIATEGLVRFKFDVSSQTVAGVESISALKKFLVENVAELRGEGDRNGKEGGLNIEGLAWDPRHDRLLLGLRSPIIDGNALLVPLKLRDPRGAYSIDNLEVEGSKAIRLSLGGLGIRGIEYDKRANGFRIISGAAEDQQITDFSLWEWNGDVKQPVLREMNRFDKTLKPEGVARVTVGPRDFLIIVFDAGGYTIIQPAR
ncbi:MAG TPA: DUF3616 domain-containing protein [Pyrinomonadaceae bacterium]|nr:DUF3616 domain-containing protein [Pyrinomonadaceae bacterium]